MAYFYKNDTDQKNTGRKRLAQVTYPLETHVYQGQAYSIQVLESPRRYQVIVNEKFIEIEQLPEFTGIRSLGYQRHL
jgi:hypothetical protein